MVYKSFQDLILFALDLGAGRLPVKRAGLYEKFDCGCLEGFKCLMCLP